MNEKIKFYLDELKKWNKNIKLVANEDAIKIISEDVIQSNKVLKNYIKDNSIADIGSGNGIVGILYAILYPNNKVYLVEKKSKKVSFLFNCKVKLNLANLNIINNDYKNVDEKFDIVLSKAFLNVKDINKLESLSKKYMFIYTYDKNLTFDYLEYSRGKFLALKTLI